MSVTKRKVGFYNLVLKKKRSEECFDPYELKTIVSYLMDKDKKDRILDNTRSNKFNLIYSSTDRKNIQNIVFGSAKYNHRPPLIDKDSVTERENPKLISEGELERTHITFCYCDDEIIIIMEERKVGLSIGRLVDYLNRFAEEIIASHGLKKDYKIEYGIIPKDDFLAELESLNRVVAGTIYTEKKLLGSEFLNFSERYDTAQEDIEITVKAKKDNSVRDTLKDFYNNLISEGSLISKIRVYGLSHENNKVILDTELIKRIEYVKTELNEITGLVSSFDIFSQLNQIAEGLIP